MTDHTRSGHDAEGAMDEMDEMDDLELITMAVNGHLSPERLAEVRHRLETDAAFREVAAPVLLTWSVPPHLGDEPRPIDELERDWDAFAKKAGIGRYRVARREASAPAGDGGRGGRRWGWWLAGLALVVAGIAAAVSAGAPRRAAAAREAALDSMSTRVPYQAGWMPLMDGIEVQLEPGSSLRRAHRRLRGMRHVLLEGSARFRVPYIKNDLGAMPTAALAVETPVGLAMMDYGEYSVTTRGDTTDVHVISAPLNPRAGLPGVVLAEKIDIEEASQMLYRRQPGGMRLIRGHDPVHLTPLPTTNP